MAKPDPKVEAFIKEGRKLKRTTVAELKKIWPYGDFVTPSKRDKGQQPPEVSKTEMVRTILEKKHGIQFTHKHFAKL